MFERSKTLVYNLIKPYSAILFLDSRAAGIILLAITFINPSVAFSGIIALISTLIFVKFIDLKEAYYLQGFYFYNSLLVGMGIGYIFSPSLISTALIFISAIFTFMFSFMINRLFSSYKIPILSLPFAVVTMFIYLASLKYSGLLSTLVNNTNIYDISLPVVIGAFFKSFGTIFFLPNTIAGILMILVVLYFSRIVVIMALTGFYFGVYVHSFLIGSYLQALNDPFTFNYILVAIALCGVFLLPTIKNYFLALIGVAISVVLTDSIGILFNYYAIPVFTLPFNITVIVFIFLLSVTYYKEFNNNIKSTPEESFSNYLSQIFRFGEIYAKLSLPFSGEWSVYQGFDDKWTHKGKYRYAYDFVKKRDGKSYEGEGFELKDYYSFGESVLSPVNGYVVDCMDDLADNMIGEVDSVNNWGNYIIIRSDLGFFVEISHIMQSSISVKVGDYVKVNSVIAKCGNSGYSPEPHIHIQVQDVGVIGAFTREFCFSEYYDDEQLIFNSIPKNGDVVGSVIENKNISSRLNFILDDILKFEVFNNGAKTDEVEFIVKMSDIGEYYFEDRDENRLYFYKDMTQFYFYDYRGGESHLKWLFILAPKIPSVNKDSISYIDYLPVYLLKSRLDTLLIELFSTINRNLYKMEMVYSFSNGKIVSKYGEVKMDEIDKGFNFIKYKSTSADNIELKRIK